MNNLLQETCTEILDCGYKETDIVFIGSESSGHSCSWEEFTELADVTYNPSYGSAEVAGDLIIVFSDNSKLYREEYDGAEWWEHEKPFKMPEVHKPIKGLLGEIDSLAEINQTT